MYTSSFKGLVLPLFSALCFSCLYEYTSDVTEQYPLLLKLLLFLTWLFTTLLLSRIIILIFERTFYLKTAKKLPMILQDICSFSVWFLSFAAFLSLVLNIDLLKLSTPTSVTIAVLGFSLRGMLMDLFSGIAMGIERPFDMDDWIEIEGYGVGKVTNTNWRVTKIVTKANEEIIIPNGFISAKVFKNYSRPTKLFRANIYITLDNNVTPEKAQRILLGAVYQVKQLDSMPKKPDLKIKDFTARGIEWNLRFWIDNYELKDDLTYQVQKNIANNLRFSSIEIPSQKHVITTVAYKEPPTNGELISLLASTDIFTPLSHKEISSIAQKAKKISFDTGEAAVVAGEEGESLFIVAEGLMSVLIPQEGDNLLHVANIVPAQVFGEMSLLTGAPRSATVQAKIETIVYEITKKDIQPILSSRPELVTQISKILMQRQIQNDQSLKNIDNRELQKVQYSMSQKFKEKIASFIKTS